MKAYESVLSPRVDSGVKQVDRVDRVDSRAFFFLL